MDIARSNAPAGWAVLTAALLLLGAACGPRQPNPNLPPVAPTPSPSPAPTPLCVTGPVGQSLCVLPASVQRGSTIQVSGAVPACDSVTIMSPAFASTDRPFGQPAIVAPVTAGHFSVSIAVATGVAPGTYPITARACGGNLGVEVDAQIV